jgi:hypothetical protein
MSGTQFKAQGAPDQRTAAPERPEANPEMVVVAGGEVSYCLVIIARHESSRGHTRGTLDGTISITFIFKPPGLKHHTSRLQNFTARRNRSPVVTKIYRVRDAQPQGTAIPLAAASIASAARRSPRSRLHNVASSAARVLRAAPSSPGASHSTLKSAFASCGPSMRIGAPLLA